MSVHTEVVCVTGIEECESHVEVSDSVGQF